MDLSNGPLFETAVFNELLRWSSWQPGPPSLYFYRTHGGRKVDFMICAPHILLAIEVKGSARAHRQDAPALMDLIEKLDVPALKRGATRLGLVVYRGREIESLAPHIWAVPDWLLFGCA